MIAFLRSLLFIFFICLPVVSQAAPKQPIQQFERPVTRPRAVKRLKIQPVTITLPASAVQQIVRDILPLPIEEIDAGGRRFQGDIILDSVSSLTIDRGQLVLVGQLSGRNLSVNANVGSQNIHIRLGSLILPVTCEISLRFDRRRQLLLFTPIFKRSSTSRNDAEEGVMALLNNLSKEYQVPLRKLKPFVGVIGGKQVFLRMEVLNIQAEDDAVTILLRPIAGQRP
jgi:hypothetical protein